MRIFGWAADLGGCGYLRLGLPLQQLASRGHETLAGGKLSPDWLDADVIVGQRVAMPGPSILWQQLAKAGRRLVYEVDDDVLDVDASNPAWNFFGQPAVQRRIQENIASASRVSVTTERLAEVMRRFNDDVRVLPNYVPASLLNHDRPRRERLTLGWSGSPSHAMDWVEVTDPLRQFLRRNPDVDLHVMGAVEYATEIRVPGQVRATTWIEDVASFHRAIDFDVTLAPLRPHLFNRAKSAIRALESAALGIPIVASDVGPYSDFVIDGVTGFLIRRPHEWGRRLRDLVEDEAMRDEMGAKARELAREWTIEGNAWRWEEALTKW